MNKHHFLSLFSTIILISILSVSVSQAQEATQSGPQEGPVVADAASAALGTSFTYQGQLKKDSSPINATCNMEFRLYDQAASGTLVAGPLTQSVAVTDGIFTTRLDFGQGAFNGSGRWLGIQVQCP